MSDKPTISENVGCAIVLGLAVVTLFAAIVAHEYIEHLTRAEAMRNGYEQHRSGWGHVEWKKSRESPQ